MASVPWFAQIVIYILAALMVFFALLVMCRQVMMLKGKAMPNPDSPSTAAVNRKPTMAQRWLISS